MLAVKVASNGIHQNWERGHAPQAAGLSQRENPLHPTIPLHVVGALHHLPPEDGKAESPVELSEGIAPPAGLQNRACHVCGTRLLS